MDMASRLNSSLQNTVISSLSGYYNLPCSDQRVTNIFMLQPTDPDYQRICRLIVNDFGSNYLAFQCNSLFCNNKGYCSTGPLLVNNTQPSSNVSTATCQCISGWKGKRCVFSTTDYDYGLNWTKGVGNWIDSFGNGSAVFNNETNFIALLGIATNLVRYTPNVENNDVEAVRSTMEKVMNNIYSANISKTGANVSSGILNLVDSSLNATDTLLGINPVEAMLRLTVPNGTNATLFGYQAVPFNQNSDVKATLNGSRARRLFMRVLQVIQMDKNRLIINQNSPEVTIPSAVSKAFNTTNTYYSMAFVRDPKPMIKSVENYIHSQVVGSRGIDNSTGNSLNFPNNTDGLRIELPWSNVPFKLQNTNYKDSCKVYYWDGKDWVVKNGCTIEDGTDENKAVVKCFSFDIIGVGCKNMNTSTIVASTNNTVTNNSGVIVQNKSSAEKTAFSFGMIILTILSIFVF
jgi:hypothetical protein